MLPREGYSDAVVTLPLMDGEKFNTNWYRNISFPLFLFNSLQVLGNARESSGDEIHLPGQSVVLRAESSKGQLKVTSADGNRGQHPVARRYREPTSTIRSIRPGSITHAGSPTACSRSPSTSLMRESDLASARPGPRGVPPDSTLAESYKIKIGYSPVSGRAIRGRYARIGGSRWRRSRSVSCFWSGISTTAEFTSEAEFRRLVTYF